MVQKLKKPIWDANGRHFGRTKPPMVDFDGLQNALWMDFGGILGGYGMGFGWVWGSLDASWLMFDLLFGRVCPKGATGTPALPRYAPRSVTIRGGSVELQRVLNKVLDLLSLKGF